MPLTVWSYPLCIAVFAAWGLMAAGTSVPIQHRLVAIDPSAASITMSWNSTAMYVGIALSPPVGNLAIRLGGAHFTPVPAAVCVALALCAFLICLRPMRRSEVALR
jgi:predicted MFS family arabinose efflux permease